MKFIFKIAFYLVIGCLQGNTFASDLLDEPHSLSDYLKTSDLVVEGEITAIDKVHIFYGYDKKQAEILKKTEQATGMIMGLPFVDYIIRVKDVIATDNMFNYKPGSAIILRMWQEDEESAYSDHMKKKFSGKNIFFLTRNPDKTTYGLITNMHQIKIDEQDNLSTTFKNQEFIPFGYNKRSDFIKEVRKIDAENKSTVR